MKQGGEKEIRCYYSRIYWDSKRKSNVIAFDTEWACFADKEGRIELRLPSLFEYTSLRDYHAKHNSIPIKLIMTALDLYAFLIQGGAAAIEESVAKTEIPDHLVAKPVISTGFGPFASLDTTIKAATQRAPSKKLRMKIFERDGYRCVVCGQRPSDDVNVTLHVHHIRPWENHGATASPNLVTLCHTCHLGLDPHYNRKLANLVDDPRERWKALQTPPKLTFDDDFP